MEPGKGTQRLGKIAREFNVGIATMVEFLNKKGYSVDPNPNAKIDYEQYQILQKEYSRDIDLKKESEKLNLRSHRHQKNESLTIDDISETDEEQIDEGDDDDVLMITDHSTSKTISAPQKGKEKEEEKEKEKEEDLSLVPKKELKVVGKIDLDKKPSKPEEEPEKKEKPKSKPKPKAKEPSKTIAEEKPVEKEEKPKKEKPVEEQKEEKETIKAKEKDRKEKKVEKTEKPQPVKTEKKKEKEEIEEIKSNIPKVENDLKVVGKIDLDSMNQRTRPPKKSKKQREQERKDRENLRKKERKEKSGIADDTSRSSKSKKVIHRKDVVDGEGASAASKKKKRKRIQKERIDISKQPSGGHNDSRPKKGQSKHTRKRPFHQEISDEDVQKQVKDTLARLTNKSKSKGSKYRREKRAAASEKLATQEAKAKEQKKTLQVTEFVSVNELANMMNVTANQVISTCMALGLFVSINQRLDAETMSLVAEEFGFKVEFISAEVMEAIEEEKDSEEEMEPRPPIVTVMGHVDHGKTSLLDHIRKTNVIAGEAGGITQHIGAYNVELSDGRKITFLDTPGHEAFTAMRARGAQVTDIAIIIVAADDNVMPQTVEAINHAAAAGVPIVFAINKIDKPGANPDAIKEKLANMNYMVEEWGGKYQSHDISAKNGIGIEELLEKILLEAEMLELKANPEKRAVGSVIESSLDRGRGYVATVLVQNGTLREGDILLAGQYMGHVKAMFNERNQIIKEAGPAEPALVLGLNGAPQAGDKFNVMESEREARQIANKREQLQREQGMRTQKHITLDEIGRRIAIGNFQELNVIVKGDVDGSIEALADSLIKLSTEEIQVNVKHKAVGQISESDVMLATASDAIIIGFQVRPSLAARKLAEQEQIDIRLYSIIYDAIEEIKAAMEGMLSPEIKEEITGTAEIQEVYKITKVGTVAGCIVRDGKINRNNKVRVIRDGIVIFTGELGSLKRFKDDVKEVTHGYECGMNVNNFNDIKVGDIIESFKEVEVAKKL
ncbi:MAG: translation initiation factor IF-2 [Prolixibacteraceae bacterium]|nr:translation initiation factor IF-2 [Prolixibacteraceae bacterium]